MLVMVYTWSDGTPSSPGQFKDHQLPHLVHCGECHFSRDPSQLTTSPTDHQQWVAAAVQWTWNKGLYRQSSNNRVHLPKLIVLSSSSSSGQEDRYHGNSGILHLLLMVSALDHQVASCSHQLDTVTFENHVTRLILVVYLLDN